MDQEHQLKIKCLDMDVCKYCIFNYAHKAEKIELQRMNQNMQGGK